MGAAWRLQTAATGRIAATLGDIYLVMTAS
jgi:hypothetical protein